MLFVIIAASVVAIAGFIWLYWDYLRCRKTWQWVHKIEAAVTDEQVLACGEPLIWRYEYSRADLLRKKRSQQARQKFWGAWKRDQTSKFHAKFVQLTEPYDRAKAFIEGHDKGYAYEEAFGMTAPQVVMSFLDDLEMTHQLVLSGNRVAMHGFEQIIGIKQSTFYAKHSIAKPSYPTYWDDVVVRVIPSPAVSDFKNTPELAVGDVRLKAAEALRQKNRKLAKLVLAYCLIEREIVGESSYRRYSSGGRSKQIVWPHREAIGDILVAQLIVMVEAMEGTNTYSQAITLKKDE